MLLNYHEMTMEESKDSPQRRYQFIVICSIIAAGFTYSVFISGVLLTIEPFETKFPGGNFCYKKISRDYSVSMGIGRRIRKDVLEAFPEDDDAAKEISVQDRKKMIEDKVYHVYLDNPEEVGGNYQRAISGVLVSDDAEKISYCDPLFKKNPGIMREKEIHKDEADKEKKASELFEQAVYESISLPSVDSLAIKFPFSNGFASALTFSYKIIPEMRQLAAEKGEEGNPPVVISQCSEVDQICTHYIPLVKGIDFHFGLPVSEQHKIGRGEDFNLFEATLDGLRVLVPSSKKFLGPTKVASSASDNAEL